MAQFDVHRNPNPATQGDVPYLLDVQSGLLDPLFTRVVVPLLTTAALPKPARHLNPVVEVEGIRCVMSTAEIAGVPRSALGPVVASLAGARAAIVRAIDFLLSGI